MRKKKTIDIVKRLAENARRFDRLQASQKKAVKQIEFKTCPRALLERVSFAMQFCPMSQMQSSVVFAVRVHVAKLLLERCSKRMSAKKLRSEISRAFGLSFRK
jgi:hypothetical protein